MKKIINKKEYTIITGLLYLCRKAAKDIERCEDAYREVMNIPPNDFHDTGHFGDAIWGDNDINDVLSKEKVKVSKK